MPALTRAAKTQRDYQAEVKCKQAAKRKATQPSAPAAPPKAKPTPKSSNKASKQPAKQRAASEPASSKRSTGKRAFTEADDDDRDSESLAPAQAAAPAKRAKRTAPNIKAQAEPRWAKKSEDDVKNQDEFGDFGVAMTGLQAIKEAVVDAVRNAMSMVTLKDANTGAPETIDVPMEENADGSQGEPGASFKDNLNQDPTTVQLGPQKPNERIVIPKELESNVTRSSDDNAFEFNIPVAKPQKCELLLWALKKNPRVVKILLRLNPRSSQQLVDCFSVALSFQVKSETWSRDVRFCDPTRPWAPDNAGAQLDNFLVLALSQSLHAAFKGNPAPEPSKILLMAFDVVNNVLSDTRYGTHCVVCLQNLLTMVWRPVACSQKCMETMATWPLELLMSPLLLDHLAFDFLLCCLQSLNTHDGEYYWNYLNAKLPAAVSQFKLPRIVSAIQKFPKLDSESTVASIAGTGSGADLQRSTMLWLALGFQGCLVSASTAATVQYMRPEVAARHQVHQFVLLNSTVAREIDFRAGHRAGKPGQAAFHGTPACNLLPILADGLRETAGGTRGIFFGSCFEKSFRYSQAGANLTVWPQSVFNNCMVVFGLENRGKAQSQEWFASSRMEDHTFDQSELMVRNVFIFKTDSSPYSMSAGWRPFRMGSLTRDVMERTFNLIEEDRAQEVRGPARLHMKLQSTV